MIIKLFRENQPFTFIISFLFAIAIWVFVSIKKSFCAEYHLLYNTNFFYLIPSLRNINDYMVLSAGINILLVFLNGAYLSRIIVKYQIIPHRTILPSFLFILLTAPYFANYNGLSFPLITLSILLFVIDILFGSLEQKGVSYGYFDSSLLLSIASFINVYILFYFVVILIILILFKGLSGRELMFMIIGIAFPYLILLSILYLFDHNIKEVFNSFVIYNATTIIHPTLIQIVLGAFSLFMVIAGSIKILGYYVKMKIATRKFSLIFLYLFLITLLIANFYPVVNKDIIFFLAAPTSFLFSFYFSTCKINLFNQILFISLLSLNLYALFY